MKESYEKGLASRSALNPTLLTVASWGWHGQGSGRYADAANVVAAAGTGRGCSGLPAGIFPVPASPTRILNNDFAPDLRQEPYEAVPHVRICAGGRRQRRSLRRYPFGRPEPAGGAERPKLLTPRPLCESMVPAFVLPPLWSAPSVTHQGMNLTELVAKGKDTKANRPVAKDDAQLRHAIDDARLRQGER
jgi:hypothetical protein